jgi:hypothetical protein
MGVLVCVIWGSMVAQQAPKPSLLSRLWDKVGFHQHPVDPPPRLISIAPGSAVTSSWTRPTDPTSPVPELVLAPAAKVFLAPAAKVTSEPESLTDQLESLRKQKTEIEQKEKEVIDALKKQYETDKVRLEKERKRLVDLGVLQEPATSPTTSMLPEHLERDGFKIKGDVDFVFEVRASWDVLQSSHSIEFFQEVGLILVARQNPESATPFSSFVFPPAVMVEQDACEGLEEERRRLEKLGVLPAKPKLFDGYGEGVGFSF